MQGEGERIRCFQLFHASIFAVLILLQCCNHSLSLDFNNISSGVVGHLDNAKVPEVIRCIQREKEALLAFKQGLMDDDNLLSSWGSEAQKQDCCRSWEGVYCDEYTGHVVKLDLPGLSLGGRLSSQVGNLTHLQYLDLRENGFASVENLNSWLPRLSSLTYLDLSWSNLSNSYDWLKAINMLPKLANLSLIGCGLHSPLIHSSTLFNINSSKSLAYVDLSSNQLTSPIFLWLSNYSTSLVRLDLARNQIEGVVSESHFSNLFRLTYLDLSSNSLALSFNSNWVPPFQLDYIALGSCKMGPHFPKWLQTQKSYYLDISNTGISDTPPNWLWEMMSPNWLSYRHIDLSNNRIRGIIPNSRFEFPPFAFIRVNLSGNQLEGPIPSFLSTATSLDLSNNKLSGLISFLCPNKVSTLAYLDLSSNNLHVQLPNCWTNFANLAMLDFSDNALFGKIPTTMSSLFKIQTLKLNKNRFVGELPSSLKNCTSLVVFDVGENNLSGMIPEWLGVGLPRLAILILRSNHFYGNIPLQLCNIKQIQILDLSINNISGSIPKCFNNLTNLIEIGNPWITLDHNYDSVGALSGSYEDEVSLIWKGIMSKYKSTLGLVKSIHLSSNQLTGEIPNEITDLVGLVSLNLSRNNLTGQITPEIGKLQSLDSLDLSNNQIHGTIPISLFQISGLGKLDLSSNNLSGRIPMGTLLQNYDPSAFAGNPLLCGIPLQQLCSPEETSPEEPPVFRDQAEDNDWFITPGFFVSLALGFVVGFWGVCGSLMFIRSWRYTYFKFLNCVYDCLYVRMALIRRRRMVYG